MKLGIMQPYFFPYIGYFQLVNVVDKYVVYDNIQYTKKGWINRNRILMNGKDAYITVPLEKDSDHLNICERKVSNSFEKNKFLNQIKGIYSNAPYFDCIFSIIEDIVCFSEKNLFLFNYNSIQKICKYLNITTEIIVSSTISINHSLKGQDKVLAICQVLNATEYYNAIGGRELYDRQIFAEQNINLQFLKSKPIAYKQFKNDFVPNLSILDVLMFNSVEEINNMLNKFELV